MGIFGVSSVKVEMLRWLLLSLTVKSRFLKVAMAGHMRPGPTTSLASSLSALSLLHSA